MAYCVDLLAIKANWRGSRHTRMLSLMCWRTKALHRMGVHVSSGFWGQWGLSLSCQGEQACGIDAKNVRKYELADLHMF